MRSRVERRKVASEYACTPRMSVGRLTRLERHATIAGMDEIEIYDTTLRDGTQGEGIALSVGDKLRIADRLDAFGVHYIEGGWPGSNPKDIEFFQEAKHRLFRRARLAAFGST